jgi:hypothetical protein
MGLIREPLDVDFVVDPRPLTLQERKMIIEFIKADKLKRAKLIDRSRKTQTNRKIKKTKTKLDLSQRQRLSPLVATAFRPWGN